MAAIQVEQTKITLVVCGHKEYKHNLIIRVAELSNIFS